MSALSFVLYVHLWCSLIYLFTDSSSSDDSDDDIDNDEIQLEVEADEDEGNGNNTKDKTDSARRRLESITFDTSLPSTHSVRSSNTLSWLDFLISFLIWLYSFGFSTFTELWKRFIIETIFVYCHGYHIWFISERTNLKQNYYLEMTRVMEWNSLMPWISSYSPWLTISICSNFSLYLQYLGDDLEDVSGRTIYDEDGLVSIPLLQLPGMVLVPGATIPLTLYHQHVVAMMKTVKDADKTFGVVAYRYIFEKPMLI